MYNSLETISAALSKLPSPNASWQAQAMARQTLLTKPQGSLGRLEELALFLSGWGSNPTPSTGASKVIIFAGNHGVTRQGVTPYPSSVTAQMVQNFEAGGAAINAITNALDLPLEVIPLALDTPTADITEAPALTQDEFLEAFNTGANAVPVGLDVLILGEMGIGNTTIAAALAAISLGGQGADWAGPGTGLDSAGVTKKANAVDKALALHADAKVATERLRCLGGRETAAIAGAILKARLKRIPVLLDGFVVTASLAPLYAENPAIIEHCIAGHTSAEPAHSKLLKMLRLKPLLNLGMRLGEATGAALAYAILNAASATHQNMATFEDAGVSTAAPTKPEPQS